jgi:phosphate transport system protein
VDEIWDDVVNLATAVESMLRQAVLALCGERAELAPAVKAQERTVDRWEVRIEKDCMLALALYEPLATDLRRIVSVLKLRAELERVSDLATKIALRAQRSGRNSAGRAIPTSLEVLARMATEAFSEVVVALGKDDGVSARSAIADDTQIDLQYRTVLRELKDSLRQQPERVTPLLRLVNSARNLERVGDHSVKIAKAILYINGES